MPLQRYFAVFLSALFRSLCRSMCLYFYVRLGRWLNRCPAFCPSVASPLCLAVYHVSLSLLVLFSVCLSV